MVKLLFNNKKSWCVNVKNYDELVETIEQKFFISSNEFYLLRDGKRLSNENPQLFPGGGDITFCLRVNGGKGGFGSMLRAIGAQIEKTTNREACRDLSGRRLRDINEEKRLKAWLEKQADREREAEERKKRKIEKLLAVPKHDFKDKEYEEARSKLTEKVNDAVEEGFKKAQESRKISDEEKPGPSTSKRKLVTAASSNIPLKKKKAALWIGDDISDGDTDSFDEEEETESLRKKIN